MQKLMTQGTANRERADAFFINRSIKENKGIVTPDNSCVAVYHSTQHRLLRDFSNKMGREDWLSPPRLMRLQRTGPVLPTIEMPLYRAGLII